MIFASLVPVTRWKRCCLESQSHAAGSLERVVSDWCECLISEPKTHKLDRIMTMPLRVSFVSHLAATTSSACFFCPHYDFSKVVVVVSLSMAAPQT
jgi:hypothetical protein